MNERSSTSKRAKIISCEGADGLGKTTQVRILAENLRAEGHRVAIIKLPRYDHLTGKLILRMLKSGSAVKYPNIFQVVQWLDKILFQVFYLGKLLRENDYVLFDRWHVSMWAYGLAGGANEPLTNRLVSSLRSPDLVLVFHGKSKRAEKQDAYESDASYQKSVAIHYVLWTCTHASTAIVNADEPKEQVSQEILRHVHSL
jgi:thymidylate kinase